MDNLELKDQEGTGVPAENPVRPEELVRRGTRAKEDKLELLDLMDRLEEPVLEDAAVNKAYLEKLGQRVLRET